MAVVQKSTHPLTRFQEFVTHIRDVPLARTERFECTFALPAKLNETINAMDDPKAHNIIKKDQTYFMSMMCEEVQIPGMVLQNKEVPIGAWNFMRNSNVNFLGNEINITFLTDINWELRHLFEAWIAHCVDPESHQCAYPDDTHGQVWINALSWDQDQNYLEGAGGDDDVDPLDPFYGPPAPAADLIKPLETVMTQWELMEVTPKVLNLIPLGAMAVGIARTTLIISSAYWRSRTIDIDLGKTTTASVEE